MTAKITLEHILQNILHFFGRYPQSPWEYLLWVLMLFAAMMAVIFITVAAMRYFDKSEEYDQEDYYSSESTPEVSQQYFFTVGDAGEQFYMVVMPSGRIQSLQINGIPVPSIGLTFSKTDMSFVIMKEGEVMLAFSALNLSPGEYQVIQVVTNNFTQKTTP